MNSLKRYSSIILMDQNISVPSVPNLAKRRVKDPNGLCTVIMIAINVLIVEKSLPVKLSWAKIVNSVGYLNVPRSKVDARRLILSKRSILMLSLPVSDQMVKTKLSRVEIQIACRRNISLEIQNKRLNGRRNIANKKCLVT